MKIKKHYEYLGKTENVLEEIVEEHGIDELIYPAARGNIYVPKDMSLHMVDERPSEIEIESVFAIPVEGVVTYGCKRDTFGKVILPTAYDSKKHNHSGDYFFAVHELLNAGIVKKEGGELVLDINQEGLNLIQEGVFAPHNGSSYYEFDSPIAQGKKGRISLHRDLDKTLALYAGLYSLCNKGEVK